MSQANQGRILTMNNNSPIYRLIKALGGIKCPYCKSKNVHAGGLLDFEADECSDCKARYTSTLLYRLSTLTFLWSFASAPFTGQYFLYKGQPDYQVWLFIASLFIIPFTLITVLYYTRGHKKWNEDESKKDQLKFYLVSGGNLLLMYFLLQDYL